MTIESIRSNNGIRPSTVRSRKYFNLFRFLTQFFKRNECSVTFRMYFVCTHKMTLQLLTFIYKCSIFILNIKPLIKYIYYHNNWKMFCTFKNRVIGTSTVLQNDLRKSLFKVKQSHHVTVKKCNLITWPGLVFFNKCHFEVFI